MEQLELFAEDARGEQAFLIWKELPGARHVLKHVYRRVAQYVPEWRKTQVCVSATLIMEEVRHLLKHRMRRAEARQIRLSAWDGYAINNSLRPYIARHVMDRRPEWAGIFELRETGRRRRLVEEKVIKVKRYV
jgi:hypothetical protein